MPQTETKTKVYSTDPDLNSENTFLFKSEEKPTKYNSTALKKTSNEKEKRNVQFANGTKISELTNVEYKSEVYS